ncbi:MAG TPA: hypothetical protein EYP36_06520 [Calditrichaeota bacterium]|nr:hypothetical protein [Calditrichota bacterium]
MNLIKDFNDALPLYKYESILGDQMALHRLHYRKAVERRPKIKIPPLKILVITVPLCGDSLAIIPVLHKYFKECEVEIRVALREESPILMNRFLTNGKKSVPVIIVLDKQGNYLFRYGPRPRPAQKIYEQMRPFIESGQVQKMEVSKKIRAFYAKDRGESIIDEFENVLSEVLENIEVNNP